MTIQQIIDYFKEKYDVEISLIQVDNICNIYFKHYNTRKNKMMKKNLDVKIEDAFAKAQKLDKFDDKYLFLKISGTKDEIKIAMPLIKYFF